MSVNIPERIKIYHIIHISKLSAVLADNYLLSDSEIQKRVPVGVTIGMKEIKRRRLEELTLSSHPGLHVGECVPFYFCPRSVMLYMLNKHNHPDIEYKEGQEPILHLFADLRLTVQWANQEGLRWAFTNSNAGTRYFEDFADLKDLDKLHWTAIKSHDWSSYKDEKQAEFLIEKRLPWKLIDGIGVYSINMIDEVNEILASSNHHPVVKQKRDWYY